MKMPQKRILVLSLIDFSKQLLLGLVGVGQPIDSWSHLFLVEAGVAEGVQVR